MKKCIFLILLAAGCSGERERQPSGGDDGAGAPAAAGAVRAESAPSRLATLTGLYEGGSSEPRHQMCIVAEGGSERFGLVVWGENLHSCSGSGTAARSGDTLRLTMAGDSACTIEAKISGNSVKLPEGTPAGCAYYCGARASLKGAELRQVGTGEADAMKAKDIVGDPLCGGF